MTTKTIEAVLEDAINSRSAFFDERHETAFRLFNGFVEGNPDLVIDLYARTLVIHNYADEPEQGRPLAHTAQHYLTGRLPWIQAVVVKTRNSQDPSRRRGYVAFGETVDRKILENGVRYAIDLVINRDASFYLDTRNVRNWAKRCLKDKSVLNTFAYTGSLGVAAQAGGAARVVHSELNRKFLNLAKISYMLNGFPINKGDFQVGDFFPQISRFKAEDERFDCVFLDPPIFSATHKGVVDVTRSYTRLINKVRPLIKHDGFLVAINNALFVSGAAYLEEIESLCAGGYLAIEELIPVPEDSVGDRTASCAAPITDRTASCAAPVTDRTASCAAPVTDPAPFNHSTKIVVMRVRRK